MTIERIVEEAIRREQLDFNASVDRFKYDRVNTGFIIHKNTPKWAIKSCIQKIIDSTPLPTIVFRTRWRDTDIVLYQTYDLLGFHKPEHPNYHKILYSITAGPWIDAQAETVDEAVNEIYRIASQL